MNSSKSGKGLKKGSSRRAKKKIIVSNINMMNEIASKVATDVANQFDQQNDTEQSIDADDSFQFQGSQETPRGGEDSASQREANDSVSMGKSMHSEADEEEKKSDVKSSRNSVVKTELSQSQIAAIGDASNTAEAFASPAKFERILDSLQSEEKRDVNLSDLKQVPEESSAADAKRQTEAIIKAQAEEEEQAELLRKKQAEEQAANEEAQKLKAIQQAELLEAERSRVSKRLKIFQEDLEKVKTQLSFFNVITPETADISSQKLENLLQEAVSLNLPLKESDYVQNDKFKSQLSYLETGLNEISIEKEKLVAAIQKRTFEVSAAATLYKSAIEKKDLEERGFLSNARSLMEAKEFESAYKELEKVELNHQEKTALWIQVTQAQEKFEKDEADRKIKLEAERAKEEQLRKESEEKAAAEAKAAQARAETEEEDRKKKAAEESAKIEKAKKEAEAAAQKAKEDQVEREKQIREQINRETAEKARLKAEAEEKKRQDEQNALLQLEQEAKELAEKAAAAEAENEPKANAVPVQAPPKKASGCPFASMAGTGVAPPHPIPSVATTTTQQKQEEESKKEERPAGAAATLETPTPENKTEEGSSGSFFKYAAVSLVIVGAAAIAGFYLRKQH